MKKRNSILLMITLLGIIFFSCNKREEEKHYFPSGNLNYIKEDSLSTFYYDTIGNIIYKKIFQFKTYDSIVFYYKNGNIFSHGKEDKEGRKFNNWNKYTLEGHLSETTEYFIIGNKAISNRFWFFNEKGDTIWYATKFNRYNQKEFVNDTLGAKNSTMIPFKIFSKDTINISEPFTASVICNSPLGRENNSQIIMLLAKEEHNFNDHFSNESQVKLDTFYNLMIDKQNRVNFNIGTDKDGYRYIVAFGRWFEKPGKKKLRGYMLEFFNYKSINNQPLKRAERRVYFEKEIYVK